MTDTPNEDEVEETGETTEPTETSEPEAAPEVTDEDLAAHVDRTRRYETAPELDRPAPKARRVNDKSKEKARRKRKMAKKSSRKNR